MAYSTTAMLPLSLLCKPHVPARHNNKKSTCMNRLFLLYSLINPVFTFGSNGLFLRVLPRVTLISGTILIHKTLLGRDVLDMKIFRKTFSAKQQNVSRQQESHKIQVCQTQKIIA